jgi:hypothetical protein
MRYVRELSVQGVQCPFLEAELELAVMLYHNIFPENTFHLEHFYLTLYYLYGRAPFSLERFLMHVRRNRYTLPVRANLTVTAVLHEKAFGYVPERLQELRAALGDSSREAQRFVASDLRVPYYFRPATFLGTVLSRAMNGVSFRSLCVQGFHMLRPSFCAGAMRSLCHRLKGVGVYEQK